MNYREIIRSHHYADRKFDGTQVTVADIAIYLIEKGLADLRTMNAFSDKSDQDLVEAEKLSRYMHDLGNTPRLVGVRVPIQGPAMHLRCESFGSYTMNGTFWLSGYEKGIFETKEEMSCGEGTLDQLHARVEEEIESLRQDPEYAGLPCYKDLDLRSGPTRKPHGWYGVTMKRPTGKIFDFGGLIWPHANKSALEIAVQKILLTAVCLYVRREFLDRLYHRTLTDVTGVLGDIPIDDFYEVDFQGGANVPPLHSEIVSYHVVFNTKDEFLRTRQTTYKAVAGRHSGADIYDGLRKTVKSQRRRRKRTEIEISRPALLLAQKTNDLVVLFEHFAERRMSGAPGHSYNIEDGQVDYSGFLDEAQKVSYERGIIRIQDMELPDTLLEACRGKPAQEVIDHPALEGCTIKKARRLKQQIAIYLDTPFLTKAECETEIGKAIGMVV